MFYETMINIFLHFISNYVTYEETLHSERLIEIAFLMRPASNGLLHLQLKKVLIVTFNETLRLL